MARMLAHGPATPARARLGRVSEISDRYRRLSGAFADTIAAVPADGWTKPSPCADWTARDVVRHMVETQQLFLGFVGHDLGDVPAVDDDPSGAWDHARSGVQADLDDPERARTTYQGALGESTFEAGVDRFLNTDLVLHGWDLARSQGRELTLEPGDMDHIDEAMAGLADKMRGPGAFGPELEPPAGADRQTRFLAFFGRRA